MKPIINKILIVSLLIIMISACRKNIATITYKGGSAPVLTSSLAASDTMVLLQADTANIAVAFKWTNPNYQLSNGVSSLNVSYSLQIDTTGDNFANAGVPTLSLTNSLDTALTVQQINAILFGQFKLSAGKPYQLQVRVQATIVPSNTETYQEVVQTSNIVTLNLVPYKTVISYPLLWVPGDYQGWAPGTAPALAFGTPYNAAFEGYINVPAGGTYLFKFTDAQDWNHIAYGVGSNANALSTSGGNITFPSPGYYRLNADTVALTWNGEVVTWGAIGSFDGWGNDAEMTYNPTTQKWWAVVSFDAAGTFKFRANADWVNPVHNLGLDATGNLIYNGGNISGPATAGKDTVFLDLHIPGNYSYSIVPQ